MVKIENEETVVLHLNSSCIVVHLAKIFYSNFLCIDALLVVKIRYAGNADYSEAGTTTRCSMYNVALSTTLYCDLKGMNQVEEFFGWIRFCRYIAVHVLIFLGSTIDPKDIHSSYCCFAVQAVSEKSEDDYEDFKEKVKKKSPKKRSPKYRRGSSGEDSSDEEKDQGKRFPAKVGIVSKRFGTI